MVLIYLFDKTIGPISFRDITQLCAVSWTIKDKDIAVSKCKCQSPPSRKILALSRICQTLIKKFLNGWQHCHWLTWWAYKSVYEHINQYKIIKASWVSMSVDIFPKEAFFMATYNFPQGLGTSSEKTLLCGKNSQVGRPPPPPPVWEFFRRNTVFLKMFLNEFFLNSKICFLAPQNDFGMQKKLGKQT